MNNMELEGYIRDMQYFQRYEMHEEALDIVKKISLEDIDLEKKCQIYRLQCLSYRKLGRMDEALVCISNAISIATDETKKEKSDHNLKQLGICLMNKGVVYDYNTDYSNACKYYKKAISLFRTMRDQEEGILINALINYGEALYNSGNNNKALFIFREGLGLLADKEDARYSYLEKKIDILENRY